jgi:toxin ParE1/3/4
LKCDSYAFRPAARRDFDDYVDYLREQAGGDRAIRFIEAARASFSTLIDKPGMGPEVLTSNSRLVGLRKWRVEHFPNILIFYIPVESGIEIVRIIHGAQDWWQSLDIDGAP